jgi:hypothetical protein
MKMKLYVVTDIWMIRNIYVIFCFVKCKRQGFCCLKSILSLQFYRDNWGNHWSWRCESWCGDRSCACVQILYYILNLNHQFHKWRLYEYLLYDTNLAGSKVTMIFKVLGIIIVAFRAVSRQRLAENVPASTDTHAIINVLFRKKFSTRSVQRSYKEDNWSKKGQKYKRLKLGGGQAYDRSSG